MVIGRSAKAGCAHGVTRFGRPGSLASGGAGSSGSGGPGGTPRRHVVGGDLGQFGRGRIARPDRLAAGGQLGVQPRALPGHRVAGRDRGGQAHLRAGQALRVRPSSWPSRPPCAWRPSPR